MSILIKNGRIWDGETFFFGNVLTEDNKIISVSADANQTADFIFDANGKNVLPGLIDVHVHMKGISSDSFGICPQMSCIPFGVTAAANAGSGFGDEKLLKSFTVKSYAFVPVGILNDEPCLENTKETLDKYGDRVLGLKVYYDTSVSEARTVNPICKINKFAEKNNLKIMIHSSNSPVPMSELLGTMRKGDILTHTYHGGKNNAAEDNFECVKEAKKRGVVIDTGFAGNVHTNFKIFKDAIAAGALPDTLGTDITRCSAYKRGGRYGMTMCMSIARRLGMKEADIFRAVTSSPAKALGKSDELGSLKIGRTADIAVLDYGNEKFDLTDKDGNRVDSSNGYRCVLTVCDGEVVYKD